IREQIAALRKEYKEIQAAEAAVSNVIGTAVNSRKSASGEPTIKDMVVAVLQERGSGADALEIIDLIKEMYGKEIPRPSMSPQLSRLKTDGVLKLDGKTWDLVEKNEGPAGPSDDVDASSDLMPTVPITPERESPGG